MKEEEALGLVCFGGWMLLGLGYWLYLAASWFVRYRQRTAPARQRARELAAERAAQQRRERFDLLAERKRQNEYRQQERQRRREVQRARSEAEVFYRTHSALLADLLPPALFRAEMESSFTDSIGVESAWQTARDLIGRMQPLILQEQQRRKEKDQEQKRHAEETRRIDEEIRQHQRKIASIRRSAFDPEVIESEIDAEEEAIERLKRQRESHEESN